MGTLSSKYSKIIRAKIAGKEILVPSDLNDPLADMTMEWTDTVIKQMQLMADEEAGHVTQLGSLIKSSDATVSESNINLEVSAPFYWKFFNYGVTGKGNPAPSDHYGTQVFQSIKGYQFQAAYPHPDMIQSIREWIPSTGLFSEAEDYDSVATGISINILKRGLEPKPFVEEVLFDQNEIDIFTKELADVAKVIFTVLFRELEEF